MKVELRDVTEADLQVFFEHQRDPEANRMASFPPRERDAFLAHWREKVIQNPHGGRKTVLVDQQVAGNVVSWEGDGVRLVGYWIGREFWGRGVASTALAAYLEHETSRPLCAWVAVDNVGSVRVLEKCGFQRISTHDHEGITEYFYRLEA